MQFAEALRWIRMALTLSLAIPLSGCGERTEVVPSICDEAGWELAYDEASSIGWSAAQVFDAFDEQVQHAELAWDDDEVVNLTLGLSHRNGEDIKHWDATPKVDQPPEDCRTRLATMAELRLDTADGALAETVIGSVEVFEDGSIEFGPSELLLRDVVGTMTERDEITDREAGLAPEEDIRISFEFRADALALEGVLSGLVYCLDGPGSGGDACDEDDYPQAFPLGRWITEGIVLP